MYDNSTNRSLPTGTGGFFTGLITGLVIGSVAVMLYAPKSGIQTRNLLKDEYNRTQDMLQTWVNDVKSRADEVSRIVRFRAEQESDRSAEEIRPNP